MNNPNMMNQLESGVCKLKRSVLSQSWLTGHSGPVGKGKCDNSLNGEH